MNSYLKLKFKNAGIFLKPKEGENFTKEEKNFTLQFKSKDQSLLSGKHKSNIIIRKERSEIPFYEEFITIDLISNVIHVLLGERPIPKNRPVFYSKIDEYVEKAGNSFIKIDSVPNITENIQTKKALHNSWNPQVYISWNIIKKYLGYELYNEFILLLNNNNINSSKKLSEIILEIRNLFKNNFIDFKEKLKNNNKSVLINYIYGDKHGEYFSQFAQSNEIRLCVNTSIAKIMKLSGEIIIPINDEDLKRLRFSKGCATILDGGLVYIDKLINEIDFNKNRILTEGFREVKNISLKTY